MHKILVLLSMMVVVAAKANAQEGIYSFWSVPHILTIHEDKVFADSYPFGGPYQAKGKIIKHRLIVLEFHDKQNNMPYIVVFPIWSGKLEPGEYTLSGQLNSILPNGKIKSKGYVGPVHVEKHK